MTAHALVTGGAGFIGSHLVDTLLARDYAVTVVDNFDGFYARETKLRNVAAHRTNPHWRLIEADIADVQALARINGRFDVIVHLAAKGGVRPSLMDPLSYQHTNVAGTQNLLEFAKARSIQKFIFASSSSVYGVNPDVPWSEDDHVLLPISPYASTKVSGELLGHVYAHVYGIQFLALRFFTVYGPRQRPDLAIHKFANQILASKPIQMFGDGNTRRDYTFVSDIVGGIVGAMSYSGSNYEVINLGNDSTVSLAEMIGELERALDKKAIVERHSEQPGDAPQTWANIDKARSLLGYDPRVSFTQGIQDFVEWLRPDLRRRAVGGFTQ